MGVILKTFNDLEFEPHPFYPDGSIASIEFDNGITASIVSCKACYSNPDDNPPSYEIAMFKEANYIPLGRYDDVLGWQTEVEINVLFEDVQTDGDGFIQSREDARIGRDFNG